jgi:uncharacterized integral membrane protein
MIAIAFLLVIVALVTIFSVQNAFPVTVSFLFWKFEASLAIVIYLLVLLGMVLGVIITSWLRLRTSLKETFLKKKQGSDAE